MKLLSWNVNGIRAAQRKGFLDWIEAEQPDILGVQETKAHEEQLDDNMVFPRGYHTFWHSGEKKGYSGVAFFCKEKPLEIIKDFGVKILNDEGRVIEARYKNFTIINVYFPNGKRSAERLKYKLDFYAAFLNYITNLKKEGHNVIFCGDVNTAHKEIDLARPKDNAKVSGFLPVERAWIDEVIISGYRDTLRDFKVDSELYTWWDMKSRARDRNVGWRIDYFFAPNELKNNISDAFILADVYGSDHCPVGIEINF